MCRCRRSSSARARRPGATTRSETRWRRPWRAGNSCPRDWTRNAGATCYPQKHPYSLRLMFEPRVTSIGVEMRQALLRRLALAAAVSLCAPAIHAMNIVVGQVGPMSGMEANQGRAYGDGVELYFRHVNKSGGV